jgi:large subunit ribosomal protein L18
MRIQKRISKQRVRRTNRVRNRVRATGRPRLSVFRSNKHIYAQVIDDVAGKTIVSASTKEASIGGGNVGGDAEAAAKVGAAIAERAQQKGIKAVAFDRGSYQYHGRVAALADAAREKGLDF